MQQLIQVLGLSGALVTPQEAGQLYDREHQEVSAQAVFFSASNFRAGHRHAGGRRAILHELPWPTTASPTACR